LKYIMVFRCDQSSQLLAFELSIMDCLWGSHISHILSCRKVKIGKLHHLDWLKPLNKEKIVVNGLVAVTRSL